MITRLTHVEVGVTDLARSTQFYTHALSFHAYADSPEAVWLKAPDEFDVWSLKLTLDVTGGLRTFGFRVDAEDRLDELAALHRSLRLPFRWLEAEEPGRGRTLRVRTGSGHVVDFQHAIEEVAVYHDGGVRLPMRTTHERTGVAPVRLDHVNIRVPDVDAALEYWRDRLGFAVSELHLDEESRVQRAWMRRMPFSHDIAIGRDAAAGFHHVAYAMRDASALLHAADVLADGGWAGLEYGPGRHGITDGHFLYLRDPDGNRIELYAGDYVRDLDRPPIAWRDGEYEERGLLWWGQQPPASFLLAGPALDRGLVDAPTAASDTHGASAPG